MNILMKIRYTKFFCSENFNRLIQQRLLKSNFSSKPNDRQAELMRKGLPKRQPLPGVKNIIIVASGKGGVGKSTISVNLAVTLSNLGLKIGLLDADIFGPSIPLMMNLNESPLVDSNNFIIPSINYNVKCLSMGLLMDSGKPVIWRGPLVMSALQRILKGAVWGPLDILIIDTPPGTGDVHLSLAQNVPITGVVLVSTPQQAALEVTKRGAEMYKTLNIDILGLIENMNHFVCSNCKHKNEIFGNATKKMVESIESKVLASLPMDQTVIECCDKGTPMCLKYPNSEYAKTFETLSETIIKCIEIENTDIIK